MVINIICGLALLCCLYGMAKLIKE